MYTLQPQKKSHNAIVIILAIIGGITIFASVCTIFGGLTIFGLPLNSGADHWVTYSIKSFGCTDYDVTYAIPNGSSQKSLSACNGSTPVYSFSSSSGDYLYLSVQNVGPDNNDRLFSCEIKVDYQTVIQVDAEGFANIASCSGTIP